MISCSHWGMFEYEGPFWEDLCGKPRGSFVASYQNVPIFKLADLNLIPL